VLGVDNNLLVKQAFLALRHKKTLGFLPCRFVCTFFPTLFLCPRQLVQRLAALTLKRGAPSGAMPHALRNGTERVLEV
jgi:hypothetical protein